MASDKPENIEDLMDAVAERYGEGTMSWAKDATALEDIVRVPLGIPSLDYSLGGGVPVGRIWTIMGWESAGKSLLAFKTAAAFQRTCRHCFEPIYQWNDQTMEKEPVDCGCDNPEPCVVMWVDLENSYTNRWASKFDIDEDSMTVFRPLYAEQMIDVIHTALSTGDIDLIVVDSVAGMTPSVEASESTEKQQRGLHARLMSKALRVWSSAQSAVGLYHQAPTLLLLNQLRIDLGRYGAHVAPGGNAVKFYASIQTKAKREEIYKTANDQPFAHKMSFHHEKNKTAPPSRGGELTLFFNDATSVKAGGTDVAIQLIRLAVQWGIISKSGSWYQFVEDGDKFQGERKAATALSQPERSEVRKEINRQIAKRELAFLRGGEIGANVTDIL